jgi:hypothetical protein
VCPIHSQRLFVAWNGGLESALIGENVPDVPDCVGKTKRIIESTEDGDCFFVMHPRRLHLAQVTLNLSQTCECSRQQGRITLVSRHSDCSCENLPGIIESALFIGSVISIRDKLFGSVSHGCRFSILHLRSEAAMTISSKVCFGSRSVDGGLVLAKAKAPHEAGLLCLGFAFLTHHLQLALCFFVSGLDFLLDLGCRFFQLR